MKVVLGIHFSSWNPAIQLEKRIPSQSLLVMKVVLGIRFSSWNPAIQLEKRIPSQSLLVMKVVLGIRFSSWNPALQLEKRIPSQSLLKGGRDEGCLGDPLFELESGSKSGSSANPS